MAVRNGIVALATLLGVFCGSAGTACVMLALDDDVVASVESQKAEPQTRADSIREWEAALSKSGKKLPADVDEMTDQEIFEAMWLEWRKYLVPESQPTVLVD